MDAEETHVGGIPAVRLANDAIEVTILAGKGADILSIRDLATGCDPLWKARWGHHHVESALSHPDSSSAWLAACVGGWNLLFPGGGAESTVAGGLQPMHGEASIVAWDVVECSTDGGSAVSLRTHLSRSPFLLERTVRLVGDTGELVIRDTAVNEGGEASPFTWTHHPTLGPPFLDDSCVIETNAATVEADETYTLPHVPLPAGPAIAWRDAAGVLGRVPPRDDPRQLLAYLHFDGPDAWYRVTNQQKEMAFEVRWSTADLPHAWFFQEMDATAGWPWFSNTYIMAIEPSSTFPGRGLAHAVDAERAAWLAPGETSSIEIAATFGPA